MILITIYGISSSTISDSLERLRRRLIDEIAAIIPLTTKLEIFFPMDRLPRSGQELVALVHLPDELEPTLALINQLELKIRNAIAAQGLDRGEQIEVCLTSFQVPFRQNHTLKG